MLVAYGYSPSTECLTILDEILCVYLSQASTRRSCVTPCSRWRVRAWVVEAENWVNLVTYDLHSPPAPNDELKFSLLLSRSFRDLVSPGRKSLLRNNILQNSCCIESGFEGMNGYTPDMCYCVNNWRIFGVIHTLLVMVSMVMRRMTMTVLVSITVKCARHLVWR